MEVPKGTHESSLWIFSTSSLGGTSHFGSPRLHHTISVSDCRLANNLLSYVRVVVGKCDLTELATTLLCLCCHNTAQWVTYDSIYLMFCQYIWNCLTFLSKWHYLWCLWTIMVLLFPNVTKHVQLHCKIFSTFNICAGTNLLGCFQMRVSFQSFYV